MYVIQSRLYVTLNEINLNITFIYCASVVI